MSFFVYFDIEDIVNSVYDDPSNFFLPFIFAEKFGLLKSTLFLRNPPDGVKGDVTSGSKYRDLFSRQLLGKINQTSWQLFFDGHSRTKNYKLWPIWGSCLELPKEDRMKAENLFLFGMWFQRGEPTHNVFFPIVHHIKHLEKNKPSRTIEGKKMELGIIIFSVVTDFPARAKASLFR